MLKYFTGAPEFDIAPMEGPRLRRDRTRSMESAFRHPGVRTSSPRCFRRIRFFGFVARQTNAWSGRPLAGFVLAREVAGEAGNPDCCRGRKSGPRRSRLAIDARCDERGTSARRDRDVSRGRFHQHARHRTLCQARLHQGGGTGRLLRRKGTGHRSTALVMRRDHG